MWVTGTQHRDPQKAMTRIGQLIEWLENNLKLAALFKKLLGLLTGPNSWIALMFVLLIEINIDEPEARTK
jgi:hypothetical protein